MGFWGIRPQDNDGSADMLGAAKDAAVEAVRRELNMLARRSYAYKRTTTTQDRWEMVGTVEGLLGLGYTVPHSMLRTCSRWLKRMRKDADWLASWEPHSVEQARVVLAYATLLDGILLAARTEKKPVRGRKSRKVGVRRCYGWPGWPMSPGRKLRNRGWFTLGTQKVYAAFWKEMALIQQALRRHPAWDGASRREA